MKHQTAIYLISIIQSVLNGEKPQEKPEHVAFEDLYSLAKFHCVESITYAGIEQLNIQPDHNLLEQWQANRDGNMIKILNQLAELESLSQLFSNNGIQHVFLKGSVLVHDYPQVDYRYLGDLDILIESNMAHKVKLLLTERGYRNTEYALSNHDTYDLERDFFQIIVEIHRDLFEDEEIYAPYFKGIMDTIPLDPASSSLKKQLDLDAFYLFMLVHFNKHYVKGGGGIRSLMDLYVFIQKYDHQLNWDKINQFLDEMNLRDFHEEARSLALSWFGSGSGQQKELSPMEEKIIGLGAYGTYTYFVEKKLNDTYSRNQSRFQSTVSYIWSRIFIPSRLMKKRYPILMTYPFLLPFAWIYRLLVILFKKTPMLRYEIKALIRKNKDN